MPFLARARALLAQDAYGTVAVLNLHRVSLSFPDPAQERAFVRGRFGRLLANALVFAVISVALCSCILVRAIARRWGDRSTFPTEAAFEINQAQMICIGFFGCVVLMVALVTRARWLASLAGPVAFEWFLVTVLTVAMCVVVLSRGWYACKISGEEPKDVWQGTVQHTDSGVLLAIDLVVTAVHVCMPIRWIILFLLEVVGAALYVACVAIGSPETNALMNLAMLLCLIAMAAIGKRSMELNERNAFAQLVRERVMRCDAEFRLSQLQSTHPARRGPASEPESSAASAPTTTNTGRVFELEEGSDVQGQFRAITALGKQEHWLLDEDDVDLLPEKCLGMGGFGFVLMGFFCGTPVAVKLVLERHGDAVMQRMRSLTNELRILRHLRHPNIVFVHGAVVDVARQRIGLVLELVQGQTVTNFMGHGSQTQNLPDVCSRYQVCMGVCSAFLYLHSRKPPIVHGDLKSANILVEGSGRGTRAKLLDFGLARVLTRHAKQLGGTLTWMAPEVFRRTAQHPQCSADIFSLGMLLHFVATREHVRAGMSRSRIKQMLRTPQPVLIEWPPDSAFLPSFKPLVESCLQVDARLRPSAAAVHEALSSEPILNDLPALFRDNTIAPDPSQVKKWSEGVRCLETSRNAEWAQERACDAEPLPPAPQQPLAPLQRPSRLETVVEELRPEQGSEPAAAPSSAPPRLLLPSLRPTEKGAMTLTVIEACSQWNYELPRGSCCGFHAGLAIIQTICRSLASSACETDFGHAGSMRQCPQCGLRAPCSAESCRAYVCRFCAEYADDATPQPTMARPRQEQL